MNLNLSIYTRYFDAINRGVKTTEYRDIKDYYIGKIVDLGKYEGMGTREIIQRIRKEKRVHTIPIDTVTFYNNGRILSMRVKRIDIEDGMFAIRLGKRTNI